MTIRESTSNRLFRALRYGAYRTIQPADAAFRRMNRLEQYPPIALRRQVGLLGFVDGPGYEFVAYLKLLLHLKPSDVIWDMGCGCGLLELALESQGWTGRVVGTDIHRPSITWAQRTIARRVPAFSFVHADIFNAAYWPRGRMSAGQWLRSFDQTGFDVVIAKSFFTHLLPDETSLYLDAISERLRPGGRALLSFFLLPGEVPAEESGASGARMRFVKPEAGAPFAVLRPAAPTAGVAYDEAFLREQFARRGFEADFHHGTWSGRSDGLSFQDLVVIRKA
jgi:SAM-dependent methyltransferase